MEIFEQTIHQRSHGFASDKWFECFAVGLLQFKRDRERLLRLHMGVVESAHWHWLGSREREKVNENERYSMKIKVLRPKSSDELYIALVVITEEKKEVSDFL